MKKESQGLCEIKGMLVGLSETRGLTPEQIKSQYVVETKRKLTAQEDYDFLCCAYNHIVGIRVRFKYYFTKDSNILFKFPMGSTREWRRCMWQNQFAEALEQEAMTKSNIDWSHIQPEDLRCTICNISFNSVNELIEHCERDKTHLENVERFLLQNFKKKKSENMYE
jgi:hypothetical protein